MEVDLISILIGFFSLAVGSAIGYIIAKKTKWLDNSTQSQRAKNKVLNDPELLIEKVKETMKKMNPGVKGDIKIIDNRKEMILGVKEENGKKVLDIKERDYTPTDKDKSPMQLAVEVEEATKKKEREAAEKKKEEEQKQREQEQMNTRDEIEGQNNPDNTGNPGKEDNSK